MSTASPPPAGRRATLAAWLLLLTFPWGVFLLNDSWVYNHTFVTAGVYTGYFLHWPDYAREFPKNYSGARLTWVAPGWLAYHVFPPWWANLGLRELVLAGTTVPLWLTLRRLGAGVAGATLGGLVMLSNPYFLQAAGWDYVNGAGLVYISWSLYFLAQAAAMPRRAGGLFGAGAAMIASVWNYLMVGFLAPAYAWFYLRQRGWPNSREGARELAWLLLGGASATALLGTLSAAAGGSFWYFLLQFKAAGAQVEAPANRYETPGVWLAYTSWLVLPCLSALAGLLLALPSLQRRWALGRVAAAVGGAMLLALGIMATLDLTGTWVALHYMEGIHATYLLPFTVLPLGLILDRHLVERSGRAQAGLVAAAAAVLLLPYAGTVGASLRSGHLFYRITHLGLSIVVPAAKPEWLPELASAAGSTIATGIVIVGLMAAALLLAPRRATLAGLAVLILGAGWLNLVTAPGLTWQFPARPAARDEFLLLFDTMAKVDALNADKQLMLWYSRSKDGPESEFINYLDLTGAFNFRKKMVVDSFPNFQKSLHTAFFDSRLDLRSQLHPGTRAVLLGSPAQIDAARANLAKIHLRLRVVHQEIVQHGDASVPLTVLIVEQS
jgi:hypothetical protein